MKDFDVIFTRLEGNLESSIVLRGAYTFGTTENKVKPLHIVIAEPWNMDALCGRRVFELHDGKLERFWRSLDVCRACLRERRRGV